MELICLQVARVIRTGKQLEHLSGVVGNLSGVVGNLSGVVGNLSGVVGNLSGVVRNLSGVVGNLSGVVGNLSSMSLVTCRQCCWIHGLIDNLKGL